MRYNIYIDNGAGKILIYTAGDPDLVLEEVHYKPVAGGAGTLSFNIAQSHPYFNSIKALSTDVWLYKDDSPVFRGRYVGSDEDLMRTGSVTIEGDLNFLLDSVQDPYNFTGTITQFVTKVINNHNAMVENRKKFTVGTISVSCNGSSMSRASSDYTTTMDCISGLVSDYGGYFRIRHESNGNYIDYVYDYGGTNTQLIRFGENLIDIKKNIDATKVITCLIPEGAEVETTTASGTEKKRVNIKSVNNNVKYISSAQGVASYGQIWGYKSFDDVTDPNVLLSAARRYLEEQISLPQTITLSAIDLALIDETTESFKVGWWTNVESLPHGVVGQYMLAEADINITAPESSTITLGGKEQTLTSQNAKSTSEVSRAVKELAASTSAEIVEKVNNATQLITGGLGGYIVIHRSASDGHPDEILIMNTPSIKTATNVIRLNQNGIGFSRSGYNGVFKNAWTIDGNLVADFITSGTMSADRVKGGTFEVGGTGYGKDGSIVIKNSRGTEIGRWDRNGISIKSGTFDVGEFYASDDEVQIGPFKVYQSDRSGADYLATSTEKVGMGNHPDFAFWAGSSGDNPPFAVKQNGYTYVKELFPQGSWWDGWSLTRVIRAMWEALQDAGYDPNDYD